MRDLLQQQSIEPSFTKRLLSPSLSTIKTNEWGWHNLSVEDEASSADHDTQSVSSSAHSAHAHPPPAVRSPTAHTASSVAKASPRTKTENSPNNPTRALPGTSYSTSRTVGKGPHPTRAISEPDPHQHPCEAPAPACALSMYMLAHRYRLDELVGLARNHILDHLTHSTCIPVL